MLNGLKNIKTDLICLNYLPSKVLSYLKLYKKRYQLNRSAIGVNNLRVTMKLRSKITIFILLNILSTVSTFAARRLDINTAAEEQRAQAEEDAKLAFAKQATQMALKTVMYNQELKKADEIIEEPKKTKETNKAASNQELKKKKENESSSKKRKKAIERNLKAQKIQKKKKSEQQKINKKLLTVMREKNDTNRAESLKKAKELLDQGASINTSDTNKKGVTALTYAQGDPEFIELLKKYDKKKKKSSKPAASSLTEEPKVVKKHRNDKTLKERLYEMEQYINEPVDVKLRPDRVRYLRALRLCPLMKLLPSSASLEEYKNFLESQDYKKLLEVLKKFVSKGVSLTTKDQHGQQKTVVEYAKDYPEIIQLFNEYEKDFSEENQIKTTQKFTEKLNDLEAYINKPENNDLYESKIKELRTQKLFPLFNLLPSDIHSEEFKKISESEEYKRMLEILKKFIAKGINLESKYINYEKPTTFRVYAAGYPGVEELLTNHEIEIDNKLDKAFSDKIIELTKYILQPPKAHFNQNRTIQENTRRLFALIRLLPGDPASPEYKKIKESENYKKLLELLKSFMDKGISLKATDQSGQKETISHYTKNYPEIVELINLYSKKLESQKKLSVKKNKDTSQKRRTNKKVIHSANDNQNSSLDLVNETALLNLADVATLVEPDTPQTDSSSILAINNKDEKVKTETDAKLEFASKVLQAAEFASADMKIESDSKRAIENASIVVASVVDQNSSNEESNNLNNTIEQLVQNAHNSQQNEETKRRRDENENSSQDFQHGANKKSRMDTNSSDNDEEIPFIVPSLNDSDELSKNANLNTYLQKVNEQDALRQINEAYENRLNELDDQNSLNKFDASLVDPVSALPVETLNNFNTTVQNLLDQNIDSQTASNLEDQKESKETQEHNEENSQNDVQSMDSEDIVSSNIIDSEVINPNNSLVNDSEHSSQVDQQPIVLTQTLDDIYKIAKQIMYEQNSSNQTVTQVAPVNAEPVANTNLQEEESKKINDSNKRKLNTNEDPEIQNDNSKRAKIDAQDLDQSNPAEQDNNVSEPISHSVIESSNTQQVVQAINTIESNSENLNSSKTQDQKIAQEELKKESEQLKETTESLNSVEDLTKENQLTPETSNNIDRLVSGLLQEQNSDNLNETAITNVETSTLHNEEQKETKEAVEQELYSQSPASETPVIASPNTQLEQNAGELFFILREFSEEESQAIEALENIKNLLAAGINLEAVDKDGKNFSYYTEKHKEINELFNQYKKTTDSNKRKAIVQDDEITNNESSKKPRLDLPVIPNLPTNNQPATINTTAQTQQETKVEDELKTSNDIVQNIVPQEIGIIDISDEAISNVLANSSLQTVQAGNLSPSTDSTFDKLVIMPLIDQSIEGLEQYLPIPIHANLVDNLGTISDNELPDAAMTNEEFISAKEANELMEKSDLEISCVPNIFENSSLQLAAESAIAPTAVDVVPEIISQNNSSTETVQKRKKARNEDSSISKDKESKERKESTENDELDLQEELDDEENPQNDTEENLPDRTIEQNTKKLIKKIKNLPKKTNSTERKKYKKEIEEIKTLIDLGFDLRLRDENGKTIMDYIKEGLHLECYNLFMNAQEKTKSRKSTNQSKQVILKTSNEKKDLFKKYEVTQNHGKDTKRLLSLLRILPMVDYDKAFKYIHDLLESGASIKQKDFDGNRKKYPSKNKNFNAIQYVKEYFESDPIKYQNLKNLMDEYSSSADLTKTRKNKKIKDHPTKNARNNTSNISLIQESNEEDPEIISISDEEDSKETKEANENNEKDLEKEHSQNYIKKSNHVEVNRMKIGNTNKLFTILKKLPSANTKSEKEKTKYKLILEKIEELLNQGVYYGQKDRYNKEKKKEILDYAQGHPKIIKLIDKYEKKQNENKTKKNNNSSIVNKVVVGSHDSVNDSASSNTLHHLNLTSVQLPTLPIVQNTEACSNKSKNKKDLEKIQNESNAVLKNKNNLKLQDTRKLFTILKNLQSANAKSEKEKIEYKLKLEEIEELLNQGVLYNQRDLRHKDKPTIKEYAKEHPEVLKLIDKYENRDNFKKYEVTKNKEINTLRSLSLLRNLAEIDESKYNIALKYLRDLWENGASINIRDHYRGRKKGQKDQPKYNAIEYIDKYFAANPQKYKGFKELIDEYVSKSMNKANKNKQTQIQSSKKARKDISSSTTQNSFNNEDEPDSDIDLQISVESDEQESKQRKELNESNLLDVTSANFSNVNLITLDNIVPLDLMSVNSLDPVDLTVSSSLTSVQPVVLRSADSANSLFSVDPAELRPSDSLGSLTEVDRPVSMVQVDSLALQKSLENEGLQTSLNDNYVAFTQDAVNTANPIKVKLTSNTIAVVDPIIDDTVIQIIDNATGQTITQLKAHSKTIYALNKLDDGRLVSYSLGELRIWEDIISGSRRFIKTYDFVNDIIIKQNSDAIQISGKNRFDEYSRQEFDLDNIRIEASGSSSSSTVRALAILNATNNL